MNGFVKLQREIQGTWIHKNPMYFKAYCDILFTVNWESKYVLIGNKRMICGVGESLLCLDSWAKLFGNGWDKSKVRRFFKKLETSHIIETQNERKTTRLKLVFIDLSADERHPNETVIDTETKRKPTPTKEGRKKNKEKRKEERVKDTPTKEEISLSEFKKLQAENDRLNLELKNKSEAQKGKEKSSAKKEKGKHEFPSNEPRKSYKANANGFPSMEQFDEMPKHEDQITTKYEAFLKDYKYPASWSEDLKESFLEWCAYKNEILLGSFGATNTKAVIREIKGYLKTYDIETVCKTIQLSLKEGWKSFDPQRVINREEKKKQDAAKQQANSTERLYESWARIVNEGIDSNGNANGSNTIDTSCADA